VVVLFDAPHHLAALRMAEASDGTLVHALIDERAVQRGRLRFRPYGTLLAVRAVRPATDAPDGPLMVELEGLRVVVTGVVLRRSPFVETAASPIVHRPSPTTTQKLDAFCATASTCHGLQVALGLRQDSDPTVCDDFSPVNGILADATSSEEDHNELHRCILSILAATVPLTGEERLDALAYSGEDDAPGLLRLALDLIAKESARLAALTAIG